MKVDVRDARRGDIVLFRGKGFVFAVLSFVLGLFYPQWRKVQLKPWHVGLVYERVFEGLIVFEALARGAILNRRDGSELDDARIYRWFDDVSKESLEQFLAMAEDRKYDVAVYFWTMMQYVLLKMVEWFQEKFIPWHHFTISLPRVLNRRYTCWELVYYFCRFMGKPIQEAIGFSVSRYPMITDLLKALEEKRWTES